MFLSFLHRHYCDYPAVLFCRSRPARPAARTTVYFSGEVVSKAGAWTPAPSCSAWHCYQCPLCSKRALALVTDTRWVLTASGRQFRFEKHFSFEKLTLGACSSRRPSLRCQKCCFVHHHRGSRDKCTQITYYALYE